MRRSTQQEYQRTQKRLIQEEGAAVNLSPERINSILKKFPPFVSDAIPEEDIDTFQKKGEIGWNFLTHSIL